MWIERYLAKYRQMSADLSAEFIRHNLIVEFGLERAFAVIEREDEFATRATRWVFAGPEVCALRLVRAGLKVSSHGFSEKLQLAIVDPDMRARRADNELPDRNSEQVLYIR